MTGTNIQKTVFKKRDFFLDLYQSYINGDMTPVGKKRDLKATTKSNEREDPENSGEEPLSKAQKLDVLNEDFGMQPGEKLVKHSSANAMNNMLPSVKTARDEAVAI